MDGNFSTSWDNEKHLWQKLPEKTIDYTESFRTQFISLVEVVDRETNFMFSLYWRALYWNEDFHRQKFVESRLVQRFWRTYEEKKNIEIQVWDIPKNLVFFCEQLTHISQTTRNNQ